MDTTPQQPSVRESLIGRFGKVLLFDEVIEIVDAKIAEDNISSVDEMLDRMEDLIRERGLENPTADNVARAYVRALVGDEMSRAVSNVSDVVTFEELADLFIGVSANDAPGIAWQFMRLIIGGDTIKMDDNVAAIGEIIAAAEEIVGAAVAAAPSIADTLNMCENFDKESSVAANLSAAGFGEDVIAKIVSAGDHIAKNIIAYERDSDSASGPITCSNDDIYAIADSLQRGATMAGANQDEFAEWLESYCGNTSDERFLHPDIYKVYKFAVGYLADEDQYPSVDETATMMTNILGVDACKLLAICIPVVLSASEMIVTVVTA